MLGLRSEYPEAPVAAPENSRRSSACGSSRTSRENTPGCGAFAASPMAEKVSVKVSFKEDLRRLPGSTLTSYACMLRKREEPSSVR